MAREDGTDSNVLLNESRELVRRALLSVEELKAVMDELNKDPDLSKIALVMLQLGFESKNLVEEILNGLDLAVLVEKLDSEDELEVIRKFFSYMGQASSGTSSGWVPEWLAENMNREKLIEKLNNVAGDVMAPVYFLECMGSVSQLLVKELVLKLNWDPIIEKISGSEDVSSLAVCLRCLLAIDPLLVEEFVKKIDKEKFARIVEIESDTKKLEDILLCVFVVRREGVAYDFVWSIIKAGVLNLVRKELKDIKLFFVRIVGNEVLRAFSCDNNEDREEIMSTLLECMGAEKIALKINGEKNETLVESFLKRIVKVNPILAMELKEKVLLKYQKFLEEQVDSTETHF